MNTCHQDRSPNDAGRRRVSATRCFTEPRCYRRSHDPLAYPTMTFPTMAGWILHLYRKVPALLNTRLKDSPGESKPESHSPEFDVEV